MPTPDSQRPEAAAPPTRAPRRPRPKFPETPDRPGLRPAPQWIAKDIPDNPRSAQGAALAILDAIVRADPPWLGALRMRRALAAALATARLPRLSADPQTLRDALHLTRPGDDPGPAGRLYLLWRRFATLPPRRAGPLVAEFAASAGPDAAPDILALAEADRAVAERLGWSAALPLASTALFDPMLGGRGGGRPRPGASDLAMSAALAVGALAAHAEAVRLERAAQALLKGAAALRTREASRGVVQILADDSVAPWRMAGQGAMNSDRAARRFCERLHAAGALRRLTDRPAFRLYGL